MDGALGRGKADGSGDSGDAESGESSVSARPAGADEGQLAGRADAVLAAVTAGCLSPRLTQQLELPFYTVSQSLSVLDVMERLEPLVSAALLMGFFALESLLFASARAQLERVVPEIFRTPWGSWALGALTFGLHFVTGSIGENAWALGAAVCWGILPLLTQLIVAIK